MSFRRRNLVNLRVERVESRALLSTSAIGSGLGNPARAVMALAQAHAQQQSSASPTLNTTDSQSPLIGSGTPTKRELARERFRAAFNGPVFKGPGRFSGQASTIYIRGTGTSNVFLHGDLNLAVVRPVDPSQPLTGEAVLQDKNINAGNVLGLQLTADQSTLDRFGRPTVMSFTSDPNIYGGNFFVTTSTGTVTIKYNGNKALASFSGLVYTNGLTNPLRNSDLFSKRQ